MKTLGIDIGGTKIYVGRYNQHLELETETRVPTEANQPKEKTLQNLLSAIEAVRDDQTTRCGIAWAGFVDVAIGRIVKAPNVPALDGFNLCNFVKAQTGLQCLIENDARAFAYGAKTALAPEAKLCLGIIIGTGVGSGIIYNDKIMYGAHGYAGEVGHMRMHDQEIENWLAGPGLKQQLGLEADTNFSTVLPEQKPEIMKSAEPALAVFSQWLGALALSFNPDHIIIGGGTGLHFWQHFQSEILERTKADLQNYPHDFELQFYTDKNAGAAGAAALSILK